VTRAISTHRREFLGRLLRAAFLAMGGGALALALWDRRGPGAALEQDVLVDLPDYRVPGQAARIAVARGTDRTQEIDRVITALGGMAAFVRAGERVLLKVNAAFATPAMLGATTHPEVVTRVTQLCLQAGAARVMVTDNPINDPASCFDLTGIGPAARAAGARVVLPSPDRFQHYSLPGGQLIHQWPVMTSPLLAADKMIGLAPVKDHHRSGASLTLKNWYGLLGGRRNIFHQQIHTIISELAQMIRPTLVILDGTQSMMTNGPTGGSVADLKATHTMIAGTDPLAVDALGVTLLDKTATDLPHLMMAQKAGVGTVDYHSLNPIYL
jgi:uncharacterized protein (DUF362 family)